MNKDVVLVFGSARSGTSWLCETMAHPRGYRLLFEPEHEQHVPEGRILTDRFLIPEANYPDIDRFLKRVFANRIDNDWIAQNSYRKFKVHLWPFLTKKKVVKFIRCNLGLHYITSKFNVPLVFIQRNPFSTIYSQNRVRFPWLFDFSRFTAQHELVKELKERYDLDLNRSDYSDLERLAIRWGIENIFPFQYSHKKLGDSKIICIKYEDLSENLELYFDIISKLGLEPSSNLEKSFYRPSSKTHAKSNIHKGATANYDQLFSSSQMKEIAAILKRFDPKMLLTLE